MQPLIVVPANDVDASGIGLDVELPAAWVTAIGEEAQARGAGPGKLEARLSRSGRADIVVRGRVKAAVEVPCARCLAPVPLEIDTELSLLLKPRHASHDASKPNGKTASPAKSGQSQTAPKAKRKKAEGEYEFTAEEADEDTYDGERVVLDPFVREAILLELPSFPLCSEACPGIGDAASEGLPGLRSGSLAAAPTEGRGGPARPNPFEALRHLLGDGAGGEPARRPSAAEVRRAARARSRSKPKMKSSLASRTKK